MVVAVDIRFAEEDYRNFIYQTLGRLARQYLQHSFIFILEDQQYDDTFIASQNIVPVVINKTLVPLLSKVLTDKKVATVLKRYKAEVFLTPTFLSQTNIAQCLIINKEIPVTSFKKAKRIISSSAFSKQNIIAKSKVDPEKIDIVYPGIEDAFQPADFMEREKIKEQYAGGNEYFFFKEENTSLDDLLNLLKGFSLFKKRQKSIMQLLIVSHYQLNPSFIQQLNLYKFKNDVKVFNTISKNELVEITAGSYAAIYINKPDFYFSQLESFKCDVPLITNDTDGSREICGNAALYINPADNRDIGEKMMLIFKDEKQRSDLINKGSQQAHKFSWNIAAERLWQSIEKAVQ